MIPLGTTAVPFRLLDTTTGDFKAYEQAKGTQGTLIMFICNHCPFVKHVNAELVRLANDYRVLGFRFIAISSNDVEKYPQDGPQRMYETARDENYTFPYLYDESQQTARDYSAVCTPDFFLFDGYDKLVYRGQLDDSRPGNGIPLTGRSIREAMDAILGNKSPVQPQKPSIGCNIKWKE